MQKTKYVLIGLLATFLVIIFSMVFIYMKRQEHLSHQYHLLCEVLQPGMSKDEVLSVLRQNGEFTVIGADSSGPVIELHIVFTDPKGKELYGAFDLGFSDYKYVAAYTRGFESSNVICHFIQPTKSVSEAQNAIP